MAIKQLSVFVENKKGALTHITGLLADAGIDMRAMSVADTQDFGILRLIVSDIAKAETTLKDEGLLASITSVIGAVIPHEPGGLNKVLQILADADVNIEYLYAFTAVSGKDACVVMRVEDNAQAERVLKENSIAILTEEDIKNM